MTSEAGRWWSKCVLTSPHVILALIKFENQSEPVSLSFFSPLVSEDRSQDSRGKKGEAGHREGRKGPPQQGHPPPAGKAAAQVEAEGEAACTPCNFGLGQGKIMFFQSCEERTVTCYSWVLGFWRREIKIHLL